MREEMRADEKVIERALQQVSRYERESRYLRKRSEEYEVLEEVLDKPTLLTLYGMMNARHFKYLNGVVSAGKEARVYWGVREDESDVAVKIFLTVAAEFRKRLPYMEGDPRFKHIRRRGIGLIETWARKEFKNLQTAHRAGVPVPKPMTVKRNVLVMEFIGNSGVPAPLLGEVPVSKRDYLRALSLVRRLYVKAGLVHADLSEFNVFKFGGRLLLFDFGSGVDRGHPMAQQFLTRDVGNIHRFFTKRGVADEPLHQALKRVLEP